LDIDISNKLSAPQRRYAEALAGGSTLPEAAAVAGISERTGRRWRNDPRVRQALGEAIDDRMGQAAAMAAVAACQALARLQELLLGPATEAPILVAACRCVLDRATELHEMYQLTERVQRLEEALQPNPEREGQAK